jgi:hypothetical protein
MESWIDAQKISIHFSYPMFQYFNIPTFQVFLFLKRQIEAASLSMDME